MAHDYSVCLALWQEALNVEIGIGITPEDGDLKALSRDMYVAKEKARDPRLESLMIHIDPDLKEVWICKKPTRLSER